MTNTRLSDQNVIEILGATNLEAKDTHNRDPLVKARIRVTLDQLRPYDNNPRTTRNPKFDDILASIEHAGLEQPPNITRRHPDDPHYMIIDGGNTRLEILNLLHEKLIRAARSHPPSDRVPYAFEQRILARLKAEPVRDVLALWVRALWRAAIPCVAVMLLFAAWATAPTPPAAAHETADLGVELESTLMASVSLDNDLPW